MITFISQPSMQLKRWQKRNWYKLTMRSRRRMMTRCGRLSSSLSEDSNLMTRSTRPSRVTVRNSRPFCHKNTWQYC